MGYYMSRLQIGPRNRCASRETGGSPDRADHPRSLIKDKPGRVIAFEQLNSAGANARPSHRTGVRKSNGQTRPSQCPSPLRPAAVTVSRPKLLITPLSRPSDQFRPFCAGPHDVLSSRPLLAQQHEPVRRNRDAPVDILARLRFVFRLLGVAVAPEDQLGVYVTRKPGLVKVVVIALPRCVDENQATLLPADPLEHHPAGLTEKGSIP